MGKAGLPKVLNKDVRIRNFALKPAEGISLCLIPGHSEFAFVYIVLIVLQLRAISKNVKRMSIAVVLLACAGCRDAPVDSKKDPGSAVQITMVELNTETPIARSGPNPTPPQKSNQAFLVPEGTKFLSRGAKVTASDMDPILGEINFITDGDKSDHMAGTVELGLGLQWVQIDLGKPHALHAILVWHSYFPDDNYYAEYSVYRRIYEDVIVQISNDPEFKNEVTTIFNNDHDNSSGLGAGKDEPYLETCEGRWMNPKGVEGRYVRLYSNGYKYGSYNRGSVTNKADFNHYIEVEVYGK